MHSERGGPCAAHVPGHALIWGLKTAFGLGLGLSQIKGCSGGGGWNERGSATWVRGASSPPSRELGEESGRKGVKGSRRRGDSRPGRGRGRQTKAPSRGRPSPSRSIQTRQCSGRGGGVPSPPPVPLPLPLRLQPWSPALSVAFTARAHAFRDLHGWVSQSRTHTHTHQQTKGLDTPSPPTPEGGAPPPQPRCKVSFGLRSAAGREGSEEWGFPCSPGKLGSPSPFAL